MANRTTVKSNIVTQNVPTVTNAILTGMLNTELADNVRFREDVAVIQVSSSSAITVDFTGKDRIDLTRTGGSLAITVSGMGDGEEKGLMITKTSGQVVTFVGVTDVTPVKANADALPNVLYIIKRVGAFYYAKAWVESPVYATESVAGVLQIATAAEALDLSNDTKVVTPAKLPWTSETQRGIVKMSTLALYNASDPATVPTSQQVKNNINTLLATDLFLTKACLAEFDQMGTTITVLKGNLTLGITRTGTGRYIITHNIGHTNYIVLGVGNTLTDNAVSVRSNVNIANNSVQLETTDDSSSNDAGQRIAFLIFG